MAVICFGVRRYKHNSINFWELLKRKREQYSITTKGFICIDHVSIFKNETYKLYAKPTVIFIIFAYIFLQLHIASDFFGVDLSYSDNKYKEYMELLEGKPTDEKTDYILLQLNYLEEIIGNEPIVREQYANGLLTSSEYNDYQIEYYKCLDEIPVLQAVLDACRLMQSTLTDCSEIDAELDGLLQEIEVVTEMTKHCIEENAQNAQDQNAYMERYNGLVSRYDQLREQVNRLQEMKAAREREADSIGAFMFELKEYDEPISEFDEKLWVYCVDRVVVHADGRMVFYFRNGAEIDA